MPLSKYTCSSTVNTETPSVKLSRVFADVQFMNIWMSQFHNDARDTNVILIFKRLTGKTNTLFFVSKNKFKKMFFKYYYNHVHGLIVAGV